MDLRWKTKSNQQKPSHRLSVLKFTENGNIQKANLFTVPNRWTFKKSSVAMLPLSKNKEH